MLTYYPIATAVLLALGSGADAATTPKQKMDFMRAMKTSTKKAHRSRKLNSESHKKFKAALYGNSKSSAALRKKVISKSQVKQDPGQRRLEDANYNNNANNNNYQNYENYKSSNGYNNNNANKNSNAYRQNGKTTDDYFAATGAWNNGFGFDPSQYSLSYHRCAEVRQFDDQLAATEDTTSVFATKHFAVLRFCPEATCMGVIEEEDEYEQWENAAQEYNEYQQQNGGNGQNQNGENGEEDQNQWYNEICYQEDTGERCERCTDEGECDDTLFGARGEGCQENYGEYMIELTDYLQMMLEWQEERFETYCEYCEECMYEVYQAWLQNGGNTNNRKLVSYEDFQASEEHQEEAHRELGGNTEGGQSANYFYNTCPEYDTCAEYMNMCNQGMEDDLTEYFECTEVERNNGMVAYVGPHCHEDGFTVTLGVYGDQYCNEYIGNGVDIANFLGYEIDIEEDAMKPWYNSMNGALDILEFSNEDDVCIPCRKGDMPYEESEYEAANDDQAEANMNYDDDELTEICETIYMASARCDRHFRSYTTKSKQAKYAEAMAQEELTCDFIDSVVMGNYNEMGFVNLDDNYTVEGQPGWMGNSMYAQQYGHYVAEVTPLQIFGLLATMAVCGILAVWSMTLHQSLSKSRGPWRPRRGLNNVSANQADLTRQNSGIVMGRSQSNASYYVS